MLLEQTSLVVRRRTRQDSSELRRNWQQP